MSNKIVFLNTCHYSLDDRVYYHQAKSLSDQNFEILIISTKETLFRNDDKISINSFDDKTLNINEKREKIVEYLKKFSPNIIICDSPLAVISAKTYNKQKKVKIIYDITEWYPSKKNLLNTSKIIKIFKIIILALVNLYAGLISNSFIFGEYYKSIPFRTLFFWKKYIHLTYYPNLQYIKHFPSNKIDSEIKLLYSGIINSEKGIDSVIKSIDIASKICYKTQFKLKVIGFFPSKVDENHFRDICSNLNGNIQILTVNPLPFLDYCKEIGKSDIFLDLRKIDIENTHCLPIKLFYYLACGRPVIYSDLRAIRHKVKEINFGHLCDPNDYNTIASHISNYIQEPDLYLHHAKNAYLESRTKYNWTKIENNFVLFILKQ